MRICLRLSLLASYLLLGSIACKVIPPPESQAPTQTSTVLAVPASTLPSISTLTIPPLPIPSQTSIPTPKPLPTFGQLLGNNTTQTILQFTLPPDWVQLNNAFINLEIPTIFLADSKETGNLLANQQSIGQGAFFIALSDILSESYQTFATDPVAAMEKLLDEGTIQGESLTSIETRSLGGMTAAYVDTSRDPLGFIATQEETLHLRTILVYPPETLTPYLILFGTQAANWDRYELLFEQLLDSITWQLRIIESPNNPVLRGEIAMGQAVTGLLNSDQTDVWTFSGEANRYLTLNLNPNTPNIDLTFTLFTPDGQLLESIDYGLPGEPEILYDAFLPETGIYTLEIVEFFGEIGRYGLTLNLYETPQFISGGQISVGQVITGELTESSRPIWTFSGEAGQLVTIILTPLDGQLDMIFDLISPDGMILVMQDETFAGDAEVLVGYELPFTGEYQVRLHSFGDKAGAYTLAVDEGGENTTNFYDAGDLVYGDVEQESWQVNEAHTWFFAGTSGDEITLSVTPLNDNLDADIWLLDPELRRLAQKDEALSGEAETISLILPTDGLYTIVVREFFGEPGDYEISILAKGYDNLEDMGEISYYQEPASGSLSAGKGAIWYFAGEEDDHINLTLTPLDQTGDFVLILQDPTGTEVARTDLGLAGEVERLRNFALTSSGQWAIVVREFFDEGGAYELELQKIEN